MKGLRRRLKIIKRYSVVKEKTVNKYCQNVNARLSPKQLEISQK